MIVKDNNSLEQSRIVKSENWKSTRFILQEDQMGFSFNITVMYAGTETNMWYKNHLESCYILAGDGLIEDVGTGEIHDLKPGTIYMLDKNDRHIVRPTTDIVMACVFTPALTGSETHDSDGSYVSAVNE